MPSFGAWQAEQAESARRELEKLTKDFKELLRDADKLIWLIKDLNSCVDVTYDGLKNRAIESVNAFETRYLPYDRN